jgi:hypothetical protein
MEQTVAIEDKQERVGGRRHRLSLVPARIVLPSRATRLSANAWYRAGQGMLPGMSREAWIVVGVVVAIIAALTLYGAIRLLRKVFVTKRMLGELGVGGKVAFYGSMIYTIFPIDLLPDPIYLDDMGVLAAALIYLTNLLRKRKPGSLPLPRSNQPGQQVTRRK